MAILTKIEIKCDRCHKLIPKDEQRHAILWRDVGQDAEYDSAMSMDLCYSCYNTVIKQGLALWSENSFLKEGGQV